MTARARRGPLWIALATLALGALDVLFALEPRMHTRAHPLAMLPFPGGASVARSASFAAGAMLIWVAAGLARRKRRAWLLALGTVVAAAIAHLGHGLYLGQAVVSLVLLVGLVRWRSRFDATGDPTTLWPVIRTLVVVGGAWAVVGSTASAHLDRTTDLGFEMLLALAAVRALHLWLRAHREPSPQTPQDAARARAIVAQYGDDSLSFFALRRDRRYHFSKAGNAFLAYRVVAGCALVSGDPIGEPGEVPQLVREFAQEARQRGWRLVALHVSERWLPIYRGLRMRALPVGDEAVLRPASFSLEGRRMRKVRQSVTRLERAGLRRSGRAARPSSTQACVRRSPGSTGSGWGKECDRGFSMAMDDLFVHPEARFVLGVGPDGRLGGFLHLVPSLRGYSLSAMRRSPETPNGLMEWLISRAADDLAEQGAEELSLNFAVFAAALRAGPGSPVGCGHAVDGAAPRPLLPARPAVQLQQKFEPEWRTRYVCFERAIDVPCSASRRCTSSGCCRCRRFPTGVVPVISRSRRSLRNHLLVRAAADALGWVESLRRYP